MSPAISPPLVTPTQQRSTSRTTALVHLDGSGAKPAQLIEQACRLARLQPTMWQQTPDGGWPQIEPPVIGIGVLRADERRVPPALGLASRLFPGLPIVLVAGEPLAREVVLLNRSQLSLVDPSLSAERLAGHLQRVVQLASRSPEVTFAAHYTRVFRPTFGWAASVSRFPSAREVNESTLVFPWTVTTREGALVGGIVPTWEHAPRLAVQTCQQALVAFQDEGTNTEARVAEILGGRGMVFSAHSDLVRIHVPEGTGGAWLFSPHRLPSISPLSGGGAVREVKPAPGDLFVMHNRVGWTPPAGPTPDGAKLLRQLQQEAAAHDLSTPSAAFLLEVW